jgi:hypothetical protein
MRGLETTARRSMKCPKGAAAQGDLADGEVSRRLGNTPHDEIRVVQRVCLRAEKEAALSRMAGMTAKARLGVPSGNRGTRRHVWGARASAVAGARVRVWVRVGAHECAQALELARRASGFGFVRTAARWRDAVSHPVFKTNQVLPICMPGSSSIHIVTSSVNNRNNIT